MAWIESHQELARHPKTLRLARRLGVSIPAAIGHLQLLWWWAMDFASDGSLAAFEAEEIATAVMWDGEPDALLAALLAAKFVDEAPDGLAIHDWHDYAGRLVTRKQANAERMREARAKNVQRTSGARAGATGPDLTIPDLTGPNPSSPTPPPQAEGGDAADAAGKKRRRGRRNVVVHDEPVPTAEPSRAPVTPSDRKVLNQALAALRAEHDTPAWRSNTDQLERLQPIGRAPDGGLHLRAPPGSGLGRFRGQIARALLDAGDSAAARVTIVEG